MLGLWGMALLTAGGFVVVLSSRLPMGVWITWNYIGGLFTLILYLWAASQACRFLVEVRHGFSAQQDRRGGIPRLQPWGGAASLRVNKTNRCWNPGLIPGTMVPSEPALGKVDAPLKGQALRKRLAFRISARRSQGTPRGDNGWRPPSRECRKALAQAAGWTRAKPAWTGSLEHDALTLQWVG